MSWLKTYYGDRFEELNPTILVEGERYAVVRLLPSRAVVGFSGMSYVLVRKNGKYGAEHKSLFEGVPTDTDIQKMRKALDVEEAK
jgi:hypothetical protein